MTSSPMTIFWKWNPRRGENGVVVITQSIHREQFSGPLPMIDFGLGITATTDNDGNYNERRWAPGRFSEDPFSESSVEEITQI